MIDLTAEILPYIGVGIFKLNENYYAVKNLLIKNKILYQEKKDTEPDWKLIDVHEIGHKYEVIQLVFFKDVLSKICVWEDFQGSLPNGIHTGMNLIEAKKIDLLLKRDAEIDEIFLSPEGYQIEYSNGTLKIISISVFSSEFNQEI